MRNLANYLFVIPVFVFLVSCDSKQIECLRISSNIIMETRDLKDFKGVVFNNIGDLLLTQGPEFSFKIEGPDNVVELITTKIENELLIIGTNACFNGDYELTVEITTPEYELINLSGIGRIESVGQIDGGIIQIELIGIGEIEADIYADSLYTTIAGTGNITYTGDVLKHELSCSGQFTLNSFSLETDHTFIKLTGIGDSFVKAIETLTVIIEGTGDVFYKGNPVIESEITGSGDIINSN